jgi:predicted Fe-S protein YdhL (DUF1289 family)
MRSTLAPSKRNRPDADAEAIESPCIRRCCLDSQDICLGCGRTLDEILAWGNAPADERRAIILAAQARRDHRSAAH